ncbi:hypothetical protein ONS95_014178 [Cadophora gregata]|uniref:uncharacterized protein n=1 Tax=Cadophora gregata TaxID=51156 RepID=UPI0026DC69D4|nr:uncharacterized protein ONS95_014178 [Cadophora gregata]KAK0113933.1 hypothetical protein ONS96_014782 [Cadophora gregata f. sp. sojae]KAK0114693.1 hypothetical protein ONS95_014178 [Cadophora gregata]
MSSFVGQSAQGIAATESSTNERNEGGNSPEAIYQGNNEAAATGGESFNDSGIFEDDDSYRPTADYKDFQLFDGDLPEIDPDTDKFFADADASVQHHTEFFYLGSNDSGVGFDDHTPGPQIPASEDDALFQDAVQQVTSTAVSNTVYEALEDYDVRSQSTYIPPPSPQVGDVAIDPLVGWVGSYLRHEYIAYQLSQPLYAVHESEE